MSERQTQKNTRGERHAPYPGSAAQVSALVSHALLAPTARLRAAAEAVTTPRINLDAYADGSVIKTYHGPQTVRAAELAQEVINDPLAAEVGPVLIRAVGQRRDGSLERRVLFFDGIAMMGGAIGPDGSLHVTKRAIMDMPALAQLPDIKIRQPWESPFGNIGQVRSVSLPQVEAFAPEDLSYPGPAGPQPLAQARDLLAQFEQTL